MAEYKVTDTSLMAVANAIRTKGGTSAQLEFPAEFVSAIAAIEGTGDVLGYEMLTGATEIDGTSGSHLTLTVDDVPFDVEGGFVWHTTPHSTSYYTVDKKTLLFAACYPTGSSQHEIGLCYNNPTRGAKGNAFASVEIFQTGSSVNLFADANYNGPYKYVLWGKNEEEVNAGDVPPGQA